MCTISRLVYMNMWESSDKARFFKHNRKVSSKAQNNVEPPRGYKCQAGYESFEALCPFFPGHLVRVKVQEGVFSSIQENTIPKSAVWIFVSQHKVAYITTLETTKKSIYEKKKERKNKRKMNNPILVKQNNNIKLTTNKR